MITLKDQETTQPDVHRPVLAFFAPNALYPPRDGGALRSIRLFESLIENGWDGFLVGANFTLESIGGVRVLETRRSAHRGKWESAARSLVCFDHYIRAKQMRKGLVDHFLTKVAQAQPDFVIMSYLFSSELMPYLKNAKVAIDTHNNDWEWFKNMMHDSRDPLKKVICMNSLRLTNAYLKKLPAEAMLLHVSPEDLTAYKQARPDLEHVIVANGCDLKVRIKKPSYEKSTKQLLFVGSLSSKMNIDALMHFNEKYWPTLRHCARLTVVGSNPPGSLELLCRQNRWALHANVDDEQLDTLYENAHMAIMPFPYGAGTKLKLAESCSRSIPVLTTPEGVKGNEADTLPESVFVSDDPNEWRRHIREYTFPQEHAQAAIDFAAKHTWSVSARGLYNLINRRFEAPISINEKAAV